MNILFIHEIDYLGKIVFDVHLLAEAMSVRGHNIYVIDYESMWKRTDKQIREVSFVSRALPNAFVTLIHPNFIRMPIVSRISAFISHYFAIKKVIQKRKIDAIVLYSVPTNGLQAVNWARKFNIPVVFRSLDVLNQLVPYSALRPIVKYLERKVYSSVDKVLTLTPKLSDYVINLGAKPEKVDVLPITVDTSLFCPSNHTEAIRQRWGLVTNDKIILFMGTLFNFSGLDSLLMYFSQIMKRIPNVKLLIVGDGQQRRHLTKIIVELNLQQRVVITGFQPYQNIPQYINLADVCVNTFVSNAITKDIFPGKTVQFLACGKPLVMRPLDGVKAVISGEEQGVVYACADNGLVDAICSLLESPEKRNEIGQNGLRYARQYHSSEKVAEQLETELLSLVAGRNCG